VKLRQIAVALALPSAMYAQTSSSEGDFWRIKIGDLIMIVAVLLAPLVALQIQQWLQDRSGVKGRKLYIFRTLMATRANRLSTEHVAALNMIDLEFYGNNSKDKEVIRAWNIYRDHLNTPATTDRDEDQSRWGEKSHELLIALLGKLSTALDYDFDAVLLKKGAYSTKWQGELEADQLLLRKGLLKLLTGETPLRMDVVSFPATTSPDEAEEQQRIRQGLIAQLEGKTPLAVIIKSPQDGRGA